jgi:glycosyltransferase involved in cell wall biosynthesis
MSGDLIWIAESDDFCDDRFLEVLVRCFDDEAVMLAYANCIFVDRNTVPVKYTFKTHVAELDHPEKWDRSYCDTAHNEVRNALGIKNTIPNASGALFKRPVEMPLLDDESWLSMVVAGDWLFYIHLIRGGKIAFSTEATNYFRRYEGSAAEVTFRKQVFYREFASVSKAIALNYNVPSTVLEQCRESCRALYAYHVGGSDDQFDAWYDYQAVLQAQSERLPNVMVATMGFYPGGAEILPVRLANEFKRQGLSVVLLSAGLHVREEGIRNMVRNDVPIVETSDVPPVKQLIRDFGIDVLNTHQWHIQKYPVHLPNVFSDLKGHVASLHGMIEHGDAFGVTEEQLRSADRNVSTWVYTAEKNLDPFADVGLLDRSSGRFVKFANGMTPPDVVPVPRVNMGIPENAFVLCCVSRAIPDKGWAEAILAVEKARAISGVDIRLILVGNGTVYDTYCQTGVPPFVYLAGFSENSVGHYAAADMGIMLTKFKSESFPLTVVDCLFAGKPYIATDVGDIRNMLTVNNEVAGAVFALDDWEVPINQAAELIAGFATDQASYQRALALVSTAANRYRIDVVASDYVRLFCSTHHPLAAH